MFRSTNSSTVQCRRADTKGKFAFGCHQRSCRHDLELTLKCKLPQVVFVHKPSGTLIATDLVWNYPGSGTPRGTKAWKFGMDRVYLPFYKKFMIKDKGMLPMN